jgi:hypothetical protein
MSGTKSGRHHAVGAASRYLAQVRTDQAEVFRDDSIRVDAFAIPHGSSLRRVFVQHGWRPTGRRVAGRGWGAILVEPIHRH